MSDETFRQERKKMRIDPSEITGEPMSQDADASQLNEVFAVQRQLGVNIPNDPDSAPNRKPVMADPRPVEGIKVTGNMPPQMQELLRKKMAAVTGLDEGQEESHPFAHLNQQQQQQPMPVRQAAPQQPPQMQFSTNNPDLNALIGLINTQNFEEVVLPSRGRFYGDFDTPNDGILHLRPMTGQEEAIISTPRFMRQSKGIEMIFRNCIQERNINPDKLLQVDRIFLLIYLRAISYGNIYEVSVKCPECGHTFDHDIDLNLPIKYCPDTFNQSNLTRTLPKTGLTFQYRLMTGFDEADVSAYRDRKSKFANSVDDSFLYKASVLIESIGNGQNTLTDRYSVQSLLEKLPSADVNFLRNVLSEPPFGVNTEIDVMCPSCGANFPVELPYAGNFFFPKERTEIELQ